MIFQKLIRVVRRPRILDTVFLNNFLIRIKPKSFSGLAAINARPQSADLSPRSICGQILIIAALLMVQFSFPEKLFSQSSADPWDQSLRGEAGRILNYQFERADRELSPARWMEEARRGILNTMAVLAGMAPEIFLDAGDEFMEWSEQELENRFTRWLLERFFGAGIETQTAGIFRETGEAEKCFIYYTGQDGSIIYDPRTGDPKIIRPGDEGHDFADDLLSWRKISHEAAERNVLDYRAGIKEHYPELLPYISPDREEEFERKLAELENNAALSLKNEFEAILAREERYFTAQRLGDVWSSRKKSEDKSADAIGTQLIEEARKVCDDGIAAIEAKIEAAKGEEGDFVLAGTRWLEEYREQFNRGLKAWEDAEERFLVRRIEWEISAEKTFDEGREAWNAVFVRFDEERRLWEEKARILFLEGEQFFAQASEALESAISVAKAQFERDSKLKTETASERAGILAGIYVINGSAAEEARKNLDYWIGEYRKRRPDVPVPVQYDALDPWIDEQLNKKIFSFLSGNKLEKNILNEIRTWLELYRNYLVKEEESRVTLMKELYSVMGKWADSDFGNTFYPDNYGIELLRLEGELEYWRNRTAIAEAVVAYAEAIDAGRVTAAESAEAWEKARIAYDEAAALYGEAEALVMAESTEIMAARNALIEAAEKMKAAEAEIEKTRQNYEALYYALTRKEAAIIEADLINLYRQLDLEQEFLGTTGESSLWDNFFTRALELEDRQFEELRNEILKQLVAGDGETMVPLAELCAKIENAGLAEDEIFRLENEIGLRLAALSLIAGKNSATEWYFAFSKSLKDDFSGLENINVEAQLLSDWERDKLELLVARARLELGALDFLEGKTTGEAEAAIASIYTGNELKMSLDREALELLLELLYCFAENQANNYSAGDLHNYLAEISEGNDRILYFIAGNSLINQENGTEMVASFLKDEVRKEEYSGGLYNLYFGLGDLAPAIARENFEHGLMQLKKLWEAINIETNDSFFPDTGTIILALEKYDDNIIPGINQINFILDELFSAFPSWLDLNLNLWKQSLIDYCASPGENTLFLAERYRDILNTALLSAREHTLSYTNDTFEREVSLYFEDPSLAFSENYSPHETESAYAHYESAIEELQTHYSFEKYIMAEIERLFALLELANNESDEGELEKALAEKDLAEENYKIFAAAYQEASANFRSAGNDYDNLCTQAENAYACFEDARKAFEIQDAIRLWAETAYLDAARPADELKYCEEKTNLFLNALDMLKSIDQDDEYLAGDYGNAYRQYEESLSLFALSLEALYKLENSIKEESERNESAYKAYKEQLNLFGISPQRQADIFRKIFQNEDGYISPDNKSLWTIADMITIDNNGFLSFSRNGGYALAGSDAENSMQLIEYFTQGMAMGDESYPVSSFELALRELEKSINAANLSQDDYIQWGLARDFLIKSILDSNPALGGTGGWYKTADTLGPDYNLGKMSLLDIPKVYYMRDYYSETADLLRRKAWDSLDGNTKKLLEFYTILTLLGGGGRNSEYFSVMTEFFEYKAAYDLADKRYKQIKRNASRPFLGWMFKGTLREISATRNSLMVPYEERNSNIMSGFYGLTQTLSSLDKKLISYQDSSAKLATLTGREAGFISWEDIEKAINLVDRFNSDLRPLKELWEKINEESGIEVQDIRGALQLLTEAGRSIKEGSALDFSRIWEDGEEKRTVYETAYRELCESYLAGQTDLKDLQAAAVLCFSGDVPSGKKHLENTGKILIENLGEFSEQGLQGTPEYSLLAEEYAEIVYRAWVDKYSAELVTRENEWNLQQKDIQEKLALWRESAGIILEQGRLAWKEAEERLYEACNMWMKTFEEEYERINDQWTAAYIEGLHDKEAWASAALDAAGKASSAAALALVGSGAEAGARAMDTRDPLGFLNIPDMTEAEKILTNLLDKSGVGNLSAAFGSILNSRESFASAVRTGIRGIDIWNSGAALTEASALARSVRDEFEAGKSRKMAYVIMDTAKEAYQMLEKNLSAANDGFRKNMDETFVIGGQWQRTGRGYRKNVIVNSTFFNRVVTDTVDLTGYQNFLLPETRFQADIYEEVPQNLNVLQTEAFIDSIYSEINELSKRIFGDGGNSEGEFQLHIGLAAIMKSGPNSDKGRDGVLEDRGSGELGRLLTEYYYWMCVESKGIALIDLAPWNKPLWDSKYAPTLKTAVGMALKTTIAIVGAPFTGGGSVVATIAISALLSSASDLVFTTMDIAGGYKSWSEAGMDFGKSLLMNTVSASAGAVFNGVENATSSFLKSGGFLGLGPGEGLAGAGFKALTGGLQTFTSGTINSVIASVSYSDSGGFGFSGETFLQSFKNSSIGTLSAATGIFTTGIMDLGIDGFTGNIYKDSHKLSGLAGGLASQGINYAFGDDFVLNIFDAGIFSKKDVHAGVLELHLGRGGVSLGLGSGGADASIGNVWSALKGFEAWGVNAQLLLSQQEAAHKYASRMRTLYSQKGVNRDEYNNVLAGRTVYEESDNSYTESVYDPVTGIKTVYLGTDALKDGSRFGLNVVFSHEAFRSGLVGDETEQAEKTVGAVMGHSKTALEILKIYGSESLGAWMTMEAIAYEMAMETGDNSIIQLFMDSYDSSGEYWKLVKNDNNVWTWFDDRSADFDISDLLNDKDFQQGKNSAKNQLINELFASMTMDGKDYGIISSGQMTPELAKVLGFSILFSSSNNGTQNFNAGNFLADPSWLITVNDTLEKIAYNEMHTTTIYNKFGKPVTLHNMDPANYSKDELLNQNSRELAGIENMAKAGCNFMDIISVPQLLTKQALNAGQITDIWNKAVEEEVIRSDGYVKSRNALANLALQKLGITNFGVEMEEEERKNPVLVGYRVEVPYGSGGHFVLTGTDKSLVYNPGNTYTDDKSKWRSIVEVYIYGK